MVWRVVGDQAAESVDVVVDPEDVGELERVEGPWYLVVSADDVSLAVDEPVRYLAFRSVQPVVVDDVVFVVDLARGRLARLDGERRLLGEPGEAGRGLVGLPVVPEVLERLEDEAVVAPGVLAVEVDPSVGLGGGRDQRAQVLGGGDDARPVRDGVGVDDPDPRTVRVVRRPSVVGVGAFVDVGAVAGRRPGPVTSGVTAAQTAAEWGGDGEATRSNRGSSGGYRPAVLPRWVSVLSGQSSSAGSSWRLSTV